MINLQTAHDHPANVLDGNLSTQGVLFAGVLRQYEQVNDVTFAALDNDALMAVRAAHEQLQETPVSVDQSLFHNLREFHAVVVDLLGLDD